MKLNRSSEPRPFPWSRKTALICGCPIFIRMSNTQLGPAKIDQCSLRMDAFHLLCIVMLYVMFQAISIARYYLNRMRREWTMLRLYCGRNICFAKFFCETLVYALFGTTIAWFVLPLYFQYVGSGFYLPTNSLGIMVAMLPMLIIATLLLTEISFFDFRKNSIAEQFSEK